MTVPAGVAKFLVDRLCVVTALASDNGIQLGQGVDIVGVLQSRCFLAHVGSLAACV